MTSLQRYRKFYMIYRYSFKISLTGIFDNDYHLDQSPKYTTEYHMNAPFSLFTRHHESNHSLPMLHSNNLFALGREIRIMHAGEEYRLRLTRNNRLILTK